MTADQLVAVFGDMTIVQGVLVVVAIGALVTILVKGWPVVKGLVGLVSLLGDLPKRLDAIDGRLERIDSKLVEVHHETHKNDGSSIKDSVGRIEGVLDQHSDMLAAALLTEDQLTERLDNLEDTFTEEN